MPGKVGLDEGFQIVAMEAIGVQAAFINWGVFRDTHRGFEHIHSADKDEGLALDRLEMTHQALNVLPIRIRFTIRDPLLGRSGSAYDQVEYLAGNFTDIG